MNQALVNSLANQGQQLTHDLLPLFGQMAWGTILWALLFTVLAMVLALLLCVTIFKKDYLQRHIMLWNVASKVSYLVILIGLPLLGAGLGLLYGSQRQISPLLNEKVQPLITAQMPGMRQYITLQVKNVPLDKMLHLKDLTASMLQQHSYQAKSDSFFERQKGNWFNCIVVSGGTEVLSQVLQYVLVKQVESVGNSLAEGYFDHESSMAVTQVSVETLRQFASGQSADLKELDRSLPGLVVKAIESKINAWFIGMYAMLGMLTLALGALIGAEIVIYRRFFRTAGLNAGGKGQE